MENNEENLESQEIVKETVSQPSQAETTTASEPKATSKTSSTTTKSFNAKTIAIAVAIIAILVFLFFNIFTRSAKSTVKDFIGAMDKGNDKILTKIMDYEGYLALGKCYGYKNGEVVYDFEKFEDLYNDQKDKLKDMDKDEKNEYKEKKEDTLESLASKSIIKLDDDNAYKYKIKEINTKKESDAKNITKVTAKIQVDNDGDKETKTYVFYTLKKGLKNYMISMPTLKK